MYEVNVRQYTPEGTLKAFEEHLPRLKALGVDVLWFMPINPIGVLNRKEALGSYYSVKDYMDVNPEFGTLDDFKEVLNKAHNMGMYVMLDWVPNHTSWDKPSGSRTSRVLPEGFNRQIHASPRNGLDRRYSARLVEERTSGLYDQCNVVLGKDGC